MPNFWLRSYDEDRSHSGICSDRAPERLNGARPGRYARCVALRKQTVRVGELLRQASRRAIPLSVSSWAAAVSDETAEKAAREVLEEIAKAEAFFKRVGAKYACPVCSNEDWVFLSAGPGQEMRPGLPMVTTPPQILGVPTTPLIAFYCDTCGFVRAHLRQKVIPE